MKDGGEEEAALALYLLRHGGPSHDRLPGDDLAAIQKRGRWRDPRSVERYEKAGRMQEAVASLSAQVLNFHSLCADQTLLFLQSPDTAPPSPASSPATRGIRPRSAWHPGPSVRRVVLRLHVRVQIRLVAGQLPPEGCLLRLQLPAALAERLQHDGPPDNGVRGRPE